jgi:hypothetical protein
MKENVFSETKEFFLLASFKIGRSSAVNFRLHNYYYQKYILVLFRLHSTYDVEWTKNG